MVTPLLLNLIYKLCSNNKPIVKHQVMLAVPYFYIQHSKDALEG